MSRKTSKKDEIRQAAEADLETFIRLVHPNRVLGGIHSELMAWWNRPGAKTHQLTLLPRDHQKSALIGYRCAHEIVRVPSVRILYLSSTSTLATKQLKFIKDILVSDIVRFYWPELVNPNEGLREKWTESEISVDHPLRKSENVRDSTIFTGGMTTSITGLHCDVAVFDDVVVKENAYTEEGRQKVREQYSLLASIEGTDAREWIVGTRYHPQDLYNDLANIKIDEYDENGDLSGSEDLYEKFERQVENKGDGTGEFLWPKQRRYDGRWFGFDAKILAKKRGQYLDKVQFRAQYYNDPNDPEGAGIKRDNFQYYDRRFLDRSDGRWFFKGERLNVFAAIDFAFSLSKQADYTSIVVVGADSRQNYYVLDIERFKSDLPSEYFQKILRLHQKWEFRKIIAEVTAAQKVIVKTLKDSYIKPYGLALAIEEYTPTRYAGSKEERILAALQPRYANNQIWHYQGGNCQVLEDELVLAHPAHDDVKDALAMCLDIAVVPSMVRRDPKVSNIISHPRFGGFG